MAHSHVYSLRAERGWVGLSVIHETEQDYKLTLQRNHAQWEWRTTEFAYEKKWASRANCRFIKRRDGGRLKINVWSANLFGKVEVLQGIQHTNNYRFDCEFVLKCFSNWPTFRIPNTYCKILEKRPINRLENWLAIPSNRLRGDRLAAKIIRFRPIQRLVWIKFSFGGKISTQPHTLIMHAELLIMYALYCLERQ